MLHAKYAMDKPQSSWLTCIELSHFLKKYPQANAVSIQPVSEKILKYLSCSILEMEENNFLNKKPVTSGPAYGT